MLEKANNKKKWEKNVERRVGHTQTNKGNMSRTKTLHHLEILPCPQKRKEKQKKPCFQAAPVRDRMTEQTFS